MIILLLLSLITVFMGYEMYWKRRSLPPGPMPLPLIGNMLPIMYYGLQDALQRFRKSHGNLITVWFGPLKMVFISDYKTIEEVLIKDGENFGARPKSTPLQREILQGGDGIVIANGTLWRDHRRFALRVLHEFGLGRTQMDDRVLDEISFMISDLEREISGDPDNSIDIQKSVDYAVGSIINNITLGYRLSDRSKFEYIKKTIDEFFELAVSPLIQVVQHHPRLARTLPIIRGIFNRQLGVFNRIVEYFENEIEIHEKDLKLDEEPRDYVEAFLQQQHHLDSIGEKGHNFFRRQLIMSLFDLWVAGQETTASTLGWIIVLVARNLDIQAKIHAELDREVGESRLVTIDDKPRLQYLQAVIHEGQRLCNLFPFNVPHRAVNTTKVHGYTIPADTVVIPQIRDVLYDEQHFPAHTKFDPGRYINEKGEFIPSQYNIPFGIGKRSCAGEPMARLELFLFTANIFNHFEINENPNNPIDLTRVETSTTVKPKPYVCKLSVRKHV